MTSTRSRIVAALAAACLALGWPGGARAQEPPKPEPEKPVARPEPVAKDKPKPDVDEALEKLLGGKADEAKDKDKDKDQPKKEADKDKPKADPDKDKPKGEVASEDKGLDKLLEGLGQTKDEPAPDDKKGGGGGGTTPQPPGDAKPGADPLDEASKKLDGRLEELTGRKPKKKPGEQDKDKGDKGEGGSGPMGDIIKEMRDVEERLGQPDTGAETRRKQAEIVKNLDTLIERMKDSPNSSSAMKMIRQGQRPGQPRPGQPGNQPGATANGAGMAKPTDPKTPPGPIELVKALWGQLPDQAREDMANVLNEHPLPTKVDLIRLYYLSLGKKSSSREE